MIYAIKILHEKINLHMIRIESLELIEHEMGCDAIFSNAEIKERKEYILQLGTAINILRKC